MRYFIRLSYKGSAFSGWQIQANAKSVQAELERALSIFCKEPVTVTGAGRTDAGVNALHYVGHFEAGAGAEAAGAVAFAEAAAEACSAGGVCHDTKCQPEKEPAQFIYKINAILPADIVAENVAVVAPDAHARFDATSRTYKYYLHTAKDPFADCSLYWGYPLDFEAMNEAAQRILGRRDFSCFEKVGSDNKTSICDVTAAGWEAIDSTHYVFTVTADRFLRNMVRAIVGTLLEIGRGRQPVSWIDTVLSSGSRSSAGQSVSGHALFLVDVSYPYQIHWLL